MQGKKASSQLDQFLDEIEPRLLAFGFRRSRRIFRQLKKDACGIVEFQARKTRIMSRDEFTINLAVVHGLLLAAYQPELSKAESCDAQIAVRLGMLLPEKADKWWAIGDPSAADQILKEVDTAFVSIGIPYVQKYMDIGELRSLWEAGQSPGLTSTQRARYLAKAREAYGP